MNNTIFRRKFVFGVLIAFVLGLGVLGVVEAQTNLNLTPGTGSISVGTNADTITDVIRRTQPPSGSNIEGYFTFRVSGAEAGDEIEIDFAAGSQSQGGTIREVTFPTTSAPVNGGGDSVITESGGTIRFGTDPIDTDSKRYPWSGLIRVDYTYTGNYGLYEITATPTDVNAPDPDDIMHKAYVVQATSKAQVAPGYQLGTGTTAVLVENATNGSTLAAEVASQPWTQVNISISGGRLYLGSGALYLSGTRIHEVTGAGRYFTGTLSVFTGSTNTIGAVTVYPNTGTVAKVTVGAVGSTHANATREIYYLHGEAALVRVSGNSQVGYTGSTLSSPLVVRLIDDANDRPVPGQTTVFTSSDTSAGVGLSPAPGTTIAPGSTRTFPATPISILTSTSGQASVNFSRLPAAKGAPTVTATSAGETVTFNVYVVLLRRDVADATITPAANTTGTPQREAGQYVLRGNEIDIGTSTTHLGVQFTIEGGNLYLDPDDLDLTSPTYVSSLFVSSGDDTTATAYVRVNSNSTAKVTATIPGSTAGDAATYVVTYFYGPITFEMVSGNNQIGNFGTQLGDPLIVQVLDGSRPVSGQEVTYTVTQGSLVKDPGFPDALYDDNFPTTATVTTDSDGKANVVLQLSEDPDPNQDSESVENTVTATFAGQMVDFTASAVEASDAARIAIVSGNNQRASLNHELTDPLIVIVHDVDGFVVEGVDVRFSTDSGAFAQRRDSDPGTLNPATATNRSRTVATDETGRAAARFNVGDISGAKRVKATVIAYDRTERDVVFNINGTGTTTPTPDPGTRTLRVSPTTHTGTSGQSVSVTVTGADPNAAVQIGSLASGTADANGSVTITFNLPSTIRTHNVTVTSGGRSVPLTLNVQASTPTQTDVRIQIPGNSSLTGDANTSVTLEARVVNSSNQQVVSGVNVDFYDSNNVYLDSDTTNNLGIASYQYTILSSPTTQIVTAEVNDSDYTVSGRNAVTFTITPTPPVSSTKTISISPEIFEGTAGAEERFTVYLSDDQSGVQVDILLPFNVNETTNINGVATFDLTLPQSGSGTASVTASGYTGADLEYEVTGPGTPTQTPVRLIIPSGASNRLSGATGTSVQLRVQVVNNSTSVGVPNVDVAFRDDRGQNLSTVQTNSSGEASVTYRVGSTTEVVTAVITDTDVDRSTATPITFTISSTGDQPTTSTLTIIQTNNAGQTSNIGAPGALHTIRVLLPQRTANQRVILDVVRTSDRTNVGTHVLSSDVTGTATTPNTFRLPTTAGTYTITASAGANTATATLTVFAIKLVKDSSDSVSGDDQEGNRGEVLDDPFALRVVRDSDDTAVQGVDVTFRVTDGDGELSASSSGANSSSSLTVRSDSNGDVEAYLVLDEDQEDNEVTASVAGVTDVTFTASGLLVPDNIEIVSGNNQQIAVNRRSAPMIVRVTDEDGNDLEGVTVSFSSRGPSGATLSPRSAITDRLGEAEADLVSRTAGTYSITARVTGVSSVTFTITVGDLADSIRIVSGNNQRGDPGTELSNPLVVEVLDEDGDTVSGVTVTFRVTGGGGSLSATSVATNSNGRAQTALTLGDSPGGNSVRASVSGVSGQVTFGATAVDPAPPEPVVHLGSGQRADSYWINTDSGTLHRLVGGSVENIASGVENVVSLVVTPDRLYWVEDTGNNSGRLRRSNLNGSNIQLIRDLTATPAGITVDTANNKIYMTNAWGKVQAINADGSGYAPNLITGLSDPKDIAVGSGKVYWITGGNTVHSANVDGSGTTQIASGYDTLGSIAVGGGKVFWTETISESDGNIHSANLNGTGVTEVVSLLAAPYGISVDAGASKLYFTNSRGRIMQSDLNGSGIQIVASNLVALGDVSVPSGTAAPRPPGTFSQYDVNRDGTVDNTDAALVAAALGESPPSNPRLDVNGDGMVNFLDLLLVFDNRDNTNAAPVALAQNLPNVSREEIQNQIEQLLASDNQSATAQFTLAYLQNLLEVVTPEKTRLLANYPNPFNPETWIPYQLATSSEVQITIYNSAGREVRTLSLGHQSKGYYTDRSSAAYWDGRNVIGEAVSSGVYFYTLTTDRMSATRKMLILK